MIVIRLMSELGVNGDGSCLFDGVGNGVAVPPS